MKTKEILNKTIKDAQAVIDKAKADMAELDKPKYRFGDYGTAKVLGVKKVYIVNKQFKTSIASYPWADDWDMWSDTELTDINILGNFIDDIKRNEVDLDDFAVNWFGAYLWGGDIRIGEVGDTRPFTLDQAIEIHQKLGQLIATYKRRKARER